jgi:hypothetical protein
MNIKMLSHNKSSLNVVCYYYLYIIKAARHGFAESFTFVILFNLPSNLDIEAHSFYILCGWRDYDSKRLNDFVKKSLSQ